MHRNKALTFRDACRYDWCSIDRFNPRTHGLVNNFRIFGPVRNQASERIAFEVHGIREELLQSIFRTEYNPLDENSKLLQNLKPLHL